MGEEKSGIVRRGKRQTLSPCLYNFINAQIDVANVLQGC